MNHAKTDPRKMGAIPPTMRAAVLKDAEASLEVLTIATPVPGPGEVLVKVSACGVCHTDLHVIKGEVAFPRPAVLGHEISGWVAALGEGTHDRFHIGEAVTAGFIMPCEECAACFRGRDDMCEKFFGMNRLKGTLYDGKSRLSMPDGGFLAMYSMGGLAEYAVVPASALAALAEGQSTALACVLGCAGLTAYGATYRAGHAEKGSRVAIIGVGGIGSSLIPMLVGAGARQIIAVDISPDKLDFARRLGATDVVNASAGDPVAEIRRLSDGGVDIAFEALGRAATFANAVESLADGGRMVAIGIAPAGERAQIEITPLVRRGYEIVGSFGARTRTDLPVVADLAASGKFRTDHLVTKTYSLDEVDEAYQALARGEIVGRAIIRIDADAE